MATKSKPHAAAKIGVKSAKGALPKKSAATKNAVAVKSKAKSVKAPIVVKSKPSKVENQSGPHSTAHPTTRTG